MPRNFNKTQKQYLFLLADGLCQGCGEPLADTWEADHVIPYSKGGSTVINNGQALCKKCNREKRDKMNSQLRDWQKRFIESYRAKNKPDYLLVATPGAGKTKASLYLVKDLLGDMIDKIIVVCPTESLKYQWKDVANEFGIDLDPDFNSKSLIKNGYDGICVTYQQVSFNSLLFDMICQSSRIFVIFDEVHHAGDSLTWGFTIRQAFSKAVRRLATSGTPFRSDNNTIPFVQYIDRKSQPDFIYGYEQALTDKDYVCRHIAFFGLDAYTAWYIGENPFEVPSFDEELSQYLESKRLEAALSKDGIFLRGMLEAAIKELNSERESDPTAGGLIVCMNTNHADDIAEIMRSLKETSIMVVHSNINEQDIKNLITSFRDDHSKKWIIAVKMVSEGIDIPRLKIGVYASNIIAELYFRQIIGRVIRRRNEDDVWASFFMPKDDRLMVFAEQIKSERQHAIREIQEREAWELAAWESEDYDDENRLQVWKTHRNPENDGLVIDEKMFNLAFRNQAKTKLAGYGFSEKEQVIIFDIFAETIQNGNGNPSAITNTEPVKESRHDREKHLRKRIAQIISKLAYSIKEDTGTKLTIQELHIKINGTWKNLGHKEQAKASVEELEEKLKWVMSLNREHYRRFV